MDTMQRSPTKTPRITPPAQEPSPRRYELDWLRALIVLALIPSHAAGFFTVAASQYLGTGYSSPIGLSTLTTLGDWGIALLFLVAGAATYFSLAHRSLRQFIGERFTRLLIPFVFASLTLIPLQDYIIIHVFPDVLAQVPGSLQLNPATANSPVAFYLWYLGAYLSFLMHYNPQLELVFWSQLWFIPRLLIISLLSLPLLRFLRSDRGARLITWLAVLCERRRGAIFLLAAPLGLVLAALGWQWQVWQVVAAPDVVNVLAQFLFYGIAYVYGFVLYADERLRRAAQRDGGVVALALGVGAFLLTQIPGVGNPALTHDYSAAGILAAFLRGLSAWLCVLAVIGLSMRYLAFTNRLGQYLSEASYPVYVIHMAALYLVGLPLLASGVNPVLRYLAMVALTLVVTLAVYEVCIRRFPPLRVLFGMRPRPAAIRAP